MEQILK